MTKMSNGIQMQCTPDIPPPIGVKRPVKTGTASVTYPKVSVILDLTSVLFAKTPGWANLQHLGKQGVFFVPPSTVLHFPHCPPCCGLLTSVCVRHALVPVT